MSISQEVICLQKSPRKERTARQVFLSETFQKAIFDFLCSRKTESARGRCSKFIARHTAPSYVCELPDIKIHTLVAHNPTKCSPTSVYNATIETAKLAFYPRIFLSPLFYYLPILSRTSPLNSQTWDIRFSTFFSTSQVN